MMKYMALVREVRTYEYRVESDDQDEAREEVLEQYQLDGEGVYVGLDTDYQGIHVIELDENGQYHPADLIWMP